MPVDYFIEICNVLCLICKNTTANKIEYESFVCNKYQGTPERLFYELQKSYNEILESLDDDNDVLPWSNSYLDFFLDFCDLLEYNSFDTDTKKILLNFFALLFFDCSKTSIVTDDWYDFLMQVKTIIKEIKPIISYDNLKSEIIDLFKSEVNKIKDAPTKDLFLKFINIFSCILLNDTKNVLVSLLIK